MKCLSCGADIKVSAKDQVINCINAVIVLVPCDCCGDTNEVVFGSPAVARAYNPMLEGGER